MNAGWMMTNNRVLVSIVTASALLIGMVAGYEKYVPNVYMPTPQDVPTIGYGTTVNPDTGKRIAFGDQKISEATAKRWLMKDVEKYEARMRRCVRVPVTQGEWDAYTSLAYNIGTGAFCGSTLVRKLNAGDYAGACKQILLWDKQKGRVLRGLTRRRNAEYKLCVGG